MHNLYTKFVKILETCKLFSENLVNELGSIPRRGPIPKFSDLEVVAFSLEQRQKALTARSGCLRIGYKSIRTSSPPSSHAGSSMIAERMQQAYAKKYAGGWL